ncbi:MAG: 23S rRNA (adenine(2503)-C(2))-methyltransferase RlmN [Planctomycetes bacterium]|nr:23S rRNA (adenine(2503)-C(2))-methyltransferase RlmN [Planctomycetota bacterium]
MSAPADSQFALTLAEAAAEAGLRGVRAEWLRRFRHLLLAGRPLDGLRREMPRQWERAFASRRLLETELLARTPAGDGSTKLLIGLRDGHAIESVVLRTGHGVSVCLSSQVGCPIGCCFCASGRDGLVRNLEAHEIVEQVVHARRVDPEVDRLVVMGIGEPLLNAERLLRALDILREESGIGPRRMVVSTIGVKGGIERLAAWGRKVSLALSLHAPDDELRGRLIPALATARVADLIGEVEAFAARTRNKAIAAYTLLRGVNDRDEHARATGELLRGRGVYLNVIPYNRVEGAPFEPVSAEHARRFVDIVRRHGAFATVRKTMGSGELAACGQLRARARSRPRA